MLSVMAKAKKSKESFSSKKWIRIAVIVVLILVTGLVLYRLTLKPNNDYGLESLQNKMDAAGLTGSEYVDKHCGNSTIKFDTNTYCSTSLDLTIDAGDGNLEKIMHSLNSFAKTQNDFSIPHDITAQALDHGAYKQASQKVRSLHNKKDCSLTVTYGKYDDQEYDRATFLIRCSID